MAYEHNWNPQDKLTYEQLIEVLTPMIVDLTDNAFAIRKGSDDGGTVVQVYIEEGLQGKTQPPLPPRCKGWRVVWVNCPTGYIDAFEIRR
tara:strand:+ start:1231 stop:1500 length:270 start_codon:yes stop_codon:yes gene_type:complete